jgi:hypothetical protein
MMAHRPRTPPHLTIHPGGFTWGSAAGALSACGQGGQEWGGCGLAHSMVARAARDRVLGTKEMDARRPRVSPFCIILPPAGRHRASCGARRAHLPSSHNLGARRATVALPATYLRHTCGVSARRVLVLLASMEGGDGGECGVDEEHRDGDGQRCR